MKFSFRKGSSAENEDRKLPSSIEEARSVLENSLVECCKTLNDTAQSLKNKDDVNSRLFQEVAKPNELLKALIQKQIEQKVKGTSRRPS